MGSHIRSIEWDRVVEGVAQCSASIMDEVLPLSVSSPLDHSYACITAWAASKAKLGWVAASGTPTHERGGTAGIFSVGGPFSGVVPAGIRSEPGVAAGGGPAVDEELEELEEELEEPPEGRAAAEGVGLLGELGAGAVSSRPSATTMGLSSAPC